jgi:inhibitor of cysteine peptidase
MIRFPRAWWSAALVVAALSGCVPAVPARPNPPPDQAAQIVQLSEADDGRAITLRVGDTLEVNLPSNPSTGYAWQAMPSPSPILEPMGEPTFRPDGGGVGAGGRVTLRYRAALTGVLELTLAYRRPVETQPPARMFTIRVMVQ